MSNTALCTLLNSDFVIMYEVFMKSFLHYNKWFDLDFVIIDIDLTQGDKDRIKAVYKKVIFKTPDYDKYRHCNFSKTHPKLQATYYKIDAFCLYDYRRVVFLDMDMVCMGNIKKLFTLNDGFYGCLGYSEPMDTMRHTINSGVFVITDMFLNPKTYNGLMRILQRGHSMPDQKTINNYFREKIQFLPKIYNVEKRMWFTKRFQDIKRDALIWHYVAEKPHEKNKEETQFEEVEKFWWGWHDESIL